MASVRPLGTFGAGCVKSYGQFLALKVFRDNKQQEIQDPDRIITLNCKVLLIDRRNEEVYLVPIIDGNALYQWIFKLDTGILEEEQDGVW